VLKKTLVAIAATGYFGASILLVAGLWYLWYRTDPAPVQPIDFPHTVHAGQLQIPCAHCHAFAGRARSAGAPPLSTCMGCHKTIATEREEIRKLTRYYEEKRPIDWKRVYALPDFIYFSHKRHVKAGITCATHLFNAQPPLAHRDPGFAGAVLASPDIFTGLIADGVHVHPAMVRMAWKCKRGRLILVTDAVSALGMPAGKYSVGGYEATVDNTTVRLSDGTLAGSIITAEACIRNLAAWAGCTLAEATPAMSAAPAELLGLRHKGRIATGADADLTLITPEGRVVATVIGGEMLWLSTTVSRVSEKPS
jgi:hypothetical protein